MHSIEFGSRHYQLPESWNELTTGQLRYLVRLTKKELSIEEIKTSMMLFTLGAQVKRYSVFHGTNTMLAIGRRKYLVSPENVSELSDLFGFLIERVNKESDDAPVYAICPDLTRNPYPKLRVWFRRYYGPEDGLFDICYEQFVWLQHYHQAMASDPTAINYLLATIFHRKKAFDATRISTDARRLKRLSSEKKMILYWFYLGSLRWIADKFPRVFSGGGQVIGNVYETQLRVIDSLAGSDMTKKDAVRRGLLYDALVSMEETVRKQEELEEKIKSKC